MDRDETETTISPRPINRLARALMKLRGETLGTVRDALGIHRPNLSAWLKGIPQRMGKEREVELLHYLGVEKGRLRSDMVHQWREAPPFESLLTVLDFDDGSGGSLSGGKILCERKKSKSVSGGQDLWLLSLPETTVRFTELPDFKSGESLIEALGARVISPKEGEGCGFASVMRQLPAWSSQESSCEVLLRQALMGLVGEASDDYQMTGKAMWMVHADLIVEAIRNERSPGQMYGVDGESAEE